jgi:hypothetical protein
MFDLDRIADLRQKVRGRGSCEKGTEVVKLPLHRTFFKLVKDLTTSVPFWHLWHPLLAHAGG